MLFVMLNPSTADASIDDATIRTCMALARRWGSPASPWSTLYAWRATDPTDLDRVPADRATGDDNDVHIVRHLGLTKHGHPGIGTSFGSRRGPDHGSTGMGGPAMGGVHNHGGV